MCEQISSFRHPKSQEYHQIAFGAHSRGNPNSAVTPPTGCFYLHIFKVPWLITFFCSTTTNFAKSLSMLEYGIWGSHDFVVSWLESLIINCYSLWGESYSLYEAVLATPCHLPTKDDCEEIRGMTPMSAGLGCTTKTEVLLRMSPEVGWVSPMTLDLPALCPGLGGNRSTLLYPLLSRQGLY